MANYPLITIGVISCNRLHYLRATLESARRCIHYPHIQWILVDNASTEPGLHDFIKSCSWLDEVIIQPQRSPKTEHVTAMNTILEKAQGEIAMIWPEDVQFITEGDWIHDCIEVLQKHEWIGGINLCGLRRCTWEKILGVKRFINPQSTYRKIRDIARFGIKTRVPQKVYSSRGMGFQTVGSYFDGIIGAGIVSLARKNTWEKLGPWRAPGAAPGLVDSSGGGETDMLKRWRDLGWSSQVGNIMVPVAADIITDPTGCKAKVRGFKRYGNYHPPIQGTFYYEITPMASYDPFNIRNSIPAEDIVRPVGFTMPRDKAGNFLKSAINKNICVDLPLAN